MCQMFLYVFRGLFPHFENCGDVSGKCVWKILRRIKELFRTANVSWLMSKNVKTWNCIIHWAPMRHLLTCFLTPTSPPPTSLEQEVLQKTPGSITYRPAVSIILVIAVPTMKGGLGWNLPTLSYCLLPQWLLCRAGACCSLSKFQMQPLV